MRGSATQKHIGRDLEGGKMRSNRRGVHALAGLLALVLGGAAQASSDDAFYLGAEAAIAGFGENRGNARVIDNTGRTAGVVGGFSINRSVEFELAYKRISGLQAGYAGFGAYSVRPQSSFSGVVQLVHSFNPTLGAGVRLGIIRTSRGPGGVFAADAQTHNSGLIGFTGRYMLSKRIALVAGVDITNNVADTDVAMVEYRAGIRGYF
jgi:hypothetical protein